VQPLLQTWIQATNRKNWAPTESSRICELHFKSVDFVDNPKSKRKLLKVDVIPTENLYNLIEESSTVDMCKYLYKRDIKSKF